MMFKPSWSVSGNFDQITKAGLHDKYEWEQHPKVPNCVKVFLEEQQARSLYRTMYDMGMVAHKNWVDE